MKQLFTLLLLLATTNLWGQSALIKEKWHNRRTQWDIFIGPKLGADFSTCTQLGGKWKPGFTGGLFGEVYLSPKVSFKIALGYAMKGTNDAGLAHPEAFGDDYETGHVYDYTFHYLDTDFTLHAYPVPQWSIYTGLELNQLIDANNKGADGASHNIKDDLHEGDLAIPVGMTYTLGNWVLDGRFSYSVRKFADSRRSQFILGKARNMSTQITVGYRIQIM